MQQSPHYVFLSRCKSFSRCEQTRGQSSLNLSNLGTKFYCKNEDKQRNSPRHTKLNCHYSANPTTVCRKNGSPCVKWPLNLTRFPLHSLSSCLSRLLYYWKAYTSTNYFHVLKPANIEIFNAHLVSHDFRLNNLRPNVIQIFFCDFLCRNHNWFFLFDFFLRARAAVCFWFQFHFRNWFLILGALYFRWGRPLLSSNLCLLSPSARGTGAWSVVGVSFLNSVFVRVEVPSWRPLRCGCRRTRTLKLTNEGWPVKILRTNDNSKPHCRLSWEIYTPETIYYFSLRH